MIEGLQKREIEYKKRGVAIVEKDRWERLDD